MMNKIFSKKSLVVMAIVTLAIVIASLLVNLLGGVNYATTNDDFKTVTVSVDDYYFRNELDEVESICEATFKEAGVESKYSYHGGMNTDGELVYVFDKDANLENVVATLQTKLQTATTTKDNALEGAFLSVGENVETVRVAMPMAYLVRAIIVIAVFVGLACVYAIVRHGLIRGAMVGFSGLVGGVFSAATVLLVRIPVTNSIYVIVTLASILSAILSLFTFNQLRSNLKSEEYKEMSAEDAVRASFACKEVFSVVGMLAVALILVGAIATWNVRWFALSSLVALASATFVGAFLTTALYIPLYVAKRNADATKTKSGYVGAKKAEKEVTEDNQ